MWAMHNELVTTDWAAKALGVHASTISRMVERGELTPAAKAPGRRGAFLFHQADVIRVAASRGRRAS